MTIRAEPAERALADERPAGLLQSRASGIADIAALREKITVVVSPLTVTIVEMGKRFTGRLDQVDKRLDRGDQRLDHIDQRLDHMDQRTDRVDGCLGGGVEQRMSGLEASMSSVNSRLGRIEGKVAK